MAIGRKKIQRPKNQLGYALYRYDRILDIDLGKILDAIKARKNLNPKKADLAVKKAVALLGEVADDISKDNFKTDYRSDKTRDIILELIQKFKKILQDAEKVSYGEGELEDRKFVVRLEDAADLRETLRVKMKDIESDYL
jgi:hypothetical protein